MIRHCVISSNLKKMSNNNDMNDMGPPPKLRRSIRENRWEDVKKRLKEIHSDCSVLVDTHYAFKVTTAAIVPLIIESATVCIMELILGHSTRTYLRHTIQISGKKWRQNNMERKEDGEVAQWILSNPSAIKGIHTEEEIERLASL